MTPSPPSVKPCKRRQGCTSFREGLGFKRRSGRLGGTREGRVVQRQACTAARTLTRLKSPSVSRSPWTYTPLGVGQASPSLLYAFVSSSSRSTSAFRAIALASSNSFSLSRALYSEFCALSFRSSASRSSTFPPAHGALLDVVRTGWPRRRAHVLACVRVRVCVRACTVCVYMLLSNAVYHQGE